MEVPRQSARDAYSQGKRRNSLNAATPHLRALIIAALSTGCRVGELLKLQWRDVEIDSSGRFRTLVLRAHKRKRARRA